MRTPRLCLCFLFSLCISAFCNEKVKLPFDRNKDGFSSSTQNREVIDGLKTDSAEVVSVLVQQPNKEVQCKPFRIQPKLFLNNSLESVNLSGNESQAIYYVVATLRHESNGNSSGRLTGNDTIEFVNNWANFSNLAISHFGQQYWLNFSIYSSDNDTHISTLISSPFDVAEYPFYVFMFISPPAQLNEEIYSITIMLFIWDFTTNMLAQPNSLNDTIWNYSISLKQHGSPVDILKGEKDGSFPLRSSRSPLHNFNLTSIGYRYQFDITIHSPSFTTRVKNTSDPFDVLWKMPASDSKYSTIALTFNGSSKDIYGEEDTFCTIFLNHFGLRHPDVLWINYTSRKSDELVIQVTLAGRTQDVEKVLENLWRDVKSSYLLDFKDKAFALQEKLEINGELYNESELSPHTDLRVFGLPITSVFTIVLMSFLCSAFAVLVIIWRVREKKVLEAYNRRIKTRARQNGHVNTAFDSNESVPEKNIYYMAVNGRHAKENGYNPDRESRIRRCSSGGFHSRSYRRMRRLGSEDGDTYIAANGVPLDDDILFPDTDKQDEVFRDVYFSPTSECLPTFASSSSSFHDEYLLRDAHAHLGRFRSFITTFTKKGRNFTSHMASLHGLGIICILLCNFGHNNISL